jgi:hypothetical protein
VRDLAFRVSVRAMGASRWLALVSIVPLTPPTPESMARRSQDLALLLMQFEAVPAADDSALRQNIRLPKRDLIGPFGYGIAFQVVTLKWA